MARWAMPDEACRGVVIQGAQTGREHTYAGRIVDVDNPRDAKTLREFGAFPVNLGGRTRGGFTCTGCGFHAFFTTCSRCGSSCTKG